MNESYAWPGGVERLLRIGADCPVQLLILPALFEEANRMRRTTVQLMRDLAERDIGTTLPDLPGTGESDIELAEIDLDDWRRAVKALAESRPVTTIAIRAGSILEPYAAPAFAWRLSPEAGARALRDLERSGQAGRTTLAGYRLSPTFQRQLREAALPAAPGRCVRLASDPAAADLKIDALPLWRRSEPGEDAALVSLIATDIAAWVETCARS